MRIADGRHKLLRWLKPLVDAPAEELPDRIAIRHVSVNDRVSEVGALALPPQIEAESLPQLAEALETAVEGDADGLGGLQRYLLLMLKGETQISRLPLRVAGGETSESGEPLDSEPATSKGLLAQLMRHNEVTTRSLAIYVGHALSAMQRTIDQQQTIIDSVGEQRLEMFAATEGLLSEKNGRELAAAEMQLKLQQRAEISQKVIQYLPVLLSKFVPASLFSKAGEPSSVALLLRSFFETFKEEQLNALSGILSEAQMMAVFDLMEKVKQQTDPKDKQDDDKQTSSNGTSQRSQESGGDDHKPKGPPS